VTVDLDSRDESIVDPIMNRSDSRFDRAVVREIVADHVRQFDGARVDWWVM
jgi:hypothetical protein